MGKIRFDITIIFAVCAASAVVFAVIMSYPLPTSTPGTLWHKPRLQFQQIHSRHDEDGDGIDDTQDIIDGARAEVRRRPSYRSAYYQGGYPPDAEGVCTDLVWRAFRDAGYDLKKMVDADIAADTSSYARVSGSPDPNIDFRRVPNLDTFFKAHAISLTLEVLPGNVANLKEWQGGDLVLFGGPKFHIGIVSDRRNDEGVPFLMHNAGDTREDDGLLYWPERVTPIIGHYRWQGNQ